MPSDKSFIRPWCRERLLIKTLFIFISISSSNPQLLPSKPLFLYDHTRFHFIAAIHTVPLMLLLVMSIPSLFAPLHPWQIFQRRATTRNTTSRHPIDCYHIFQKPALTMRISFACNSNQSHNTIKTHLQPE